MAGENSLQKAGIEPSTLWLSQQGSVQLTITPQWLVYLVHISLYIDLRDLPHNYLLNSS